MQERVRQSGNTFRDHNKFYSLLNSGERNTSGDGEPKNPIGGVSSPDSDEVRRVIFLRKNDLAPANIKLVKHGGD